MTNDTKAEEAIQTVRLTTCDNPYNPFLQYEEWYAFDVSKGYNTLAYIARIASVFNAPNISDDVFEDESLVQELYNQVVENIIKTNVLGIYVKVTANGFKFNAKGTLE